MYKCIRGLNSVHSLRRYKLRKKYILARNFRRQTISKETEKVPAFKHVLAFVIEQHQQLGHSLIFRRELMDGNI